MPTDTDSLLGAIIAELLEELDRAFLGPRKWIYCYRSPEGDCPAREFLESLPREARASYAKQFQRACSGDRLRGDKWHPWKGKGDEGLCVYKDIQSKSRLVHITEHGNLHVLLFGFTGKKEDKVDQVHINRARRMRDEYAERRKEIADRLKRKK
jgi:hypothetical protein